ncbi:PEP-CTERM sorting domain-containing protein [Bythopirellula polymerisocia]|uniref:Ice-binding protein C-terminal domain-containing protein n=1 Tax=Bythopirellula polymerisocia TaxID=2528003 RepID=A0A5C6C6Y4_9BACT|nr:PEP-CTERM sorting domain-containing protein [Bythopirellula polymerisocia]TWU20393.1 hypothetical protein Pla144_49680 [Bythopirellula polymerisocia]
MKNTLLHQFISTATVIRYSLASLAALVLVGLAASTSHAVVIGNFNFMIGESDRYLEAILDFNRGEITQAQLNAIHHEESCKNPSIRLQQRNRPAILVQNLSAQENELSTFVIDLKQAGFSFGLGDSPSEGFNGTPVSPTNRSDPGVGVTGVLDATNTKLTLSFTGLTSTPSIQNAAIFRIDLDPTPFISALYPDYREVLLGSDAGNGPTDPAMVQATFSMTGMPDATTPLTTLNGPPTVSDAGLLEVYHAQTPTNMFETDGGTIPEPATASLLGIAMLGLIGRRRRA